MPFSNVKTFYYAMSFWDLLDGERPTQFADVAFLCVDEESILQIFDGQGVSTWIFSTDPMPQDPLFTVDLKTTAYGFDFRRIPSAHRKHLFGRMRVTGDFGSGVERLVFKFSLHEYKNRIGPLIRSFFVSNAGG